MQKVRCTRAWPGEPRPGYPLSRKLFQLCALQGKRNPGPRSWPKTEKEKANQNETKRTVQIEKTLEEAEDGRVAGHSQRGRVVHLGHSPSAPVGTTTTTTTTTSASNHQRQTTDGPFEWGADWRTGIWPGQVKTSDQKLWPSSDSSRPEVAMMVCLTWATLLPASPASWVPLFGNSNFRFLMILFKFAYSSVCWRLFKCRMPTADSRLLLTALFFPYFSLFFFWRKLFKLAGISATKLVLSLAPVFGPINIVGLSHDLCSPFGQRGRDLLSYQS